jgi:hypothetical protein
MKSVIYIVTNKFIITIIRTQLHKQTQLESNHTGVRNLLFFYVITLPVNSVRFKGVQAAWFHHIKSLSVTLNAPPPKAIHVPLLSLNDADSDTEWHISFDSPVVPDTLINLFLNLNKYYNLWGGGVIFKYISRISGVKVWTRFIWLRIRSSFGNGSSG